MSSSTETSATTSASLVAAEEALLRTTGIPVERHETVVQGIRLHYLTCGQGEPLVMLHGRGMAGALFAPVLPLLAAHRRIITLDLPGWGLSDKPPFTGHTPKDALRLWTESVLGFLDDQGLTQVDLLGHSMGGFTALGVALEHPARVRRLVLVDPGGLGTRMQLDVRLYFGLVPEKLHRRFGKRLTRIVNRQGIGARDPESADAALELVHALLTQEDVLASGAAAFKTWVNLSGVHMTVLDRLKELAMPVLMIWGDRDVVVSYQDGLAAARYLRDGQLVAFTGSGHTPFVDRPDEFARILLTWLNNVHIPSRV